MFRRRLPLSSVVFAVAGVMCALAAVGIMHAYGERLVAAHPPVGRPVAVQVATRPLARGTRLSADMLRTEQIPSAFVPPGSIGDADRLVGHIIAADLALGDVVTKTRLAGASVGPVAALVPPGWRALVVPTDLPASAVAPGDLVDVLAAFGGKSRVETVAREVQVARVLPPAPAGLQGPGGASGPSLILIVDPDTADQLTYALAFGRPVVAVDPPGVP
jgi:Flp pilus assembly protein CpaB